MSPDPQAKICLRCGTDCAGKPRHRDARGRYFCDPCYTILLAQGKSGTKAPSAAPGACPKCAGALPAGAVLCVQCGHRLDTGETLGTRVDDDPAPGRSDDDDEDRLTLGGILRSPVSACTLAVLSLAGYAAMVLGEGGEGAVQSLALGLTFAFLIYTAALWASANMFLVVEGGWAVQLPRLAAITGITACAGEGTARLAELAVPGAGEGAILAGVAALAFNVVVARFMLGIFFIEALLYTLVVIAFGVVGIAILILASCVGAI